MIKIFKKLLPGLIIALLLVGFPVANNLAYAKTGSKTSTAKKSYSKKVSKKSSRHKFSRRAKERLDLTPNMFTLDTAPHSPKPIARSSKKKSTGKKTSTKKKA